MSRFVAAITRASLVRVSAEPVRKIRIFQPDAYISIDLRENKTTRNFGGMRLGCWINAIPVGGIVLAPDGSEIRLLRFLHVATG